MSDMKCPFCQQELKEIYCNDIWVGLACKNVGCLETKSTLGNEALWQELIRTHKELEQSKICCTEWEKQALDYKAENIALSGDLERTRKALEIAKDGLKHLYETNDDYVPGFAVPCGIKGYVKEKLDQITALEQKDK